MGGEGIMKGESALPQEKPTPKKGGPQKLNEEVCRSRLEFLFDGVFAIAMTILVLDLKVPELNEPKSGLALLRGIAHHGAGFAGYFISFAMLGMLWYNHQYQFRHIRRVRRSVLIANLGLMFTAAAFPFCAATFSRYPTNPFSIVFYMACIFLHTVFSHAQWRLAYRGGDLDPDLDSAKARKILSGTLRAALITGAMTLLYSIIGLTRL
jgi:uncharacterized membrane protein